MEKVRINLTFNCKDTAQKNAVLLLKKMKKKKSSFIALLIDLLRKEYSSLNNEYITFESFSREICNSPKSINQNAIIKQTYFQITNEIINELRLSNPEQSVELYEQLNLLCIRSNDFDEESYLKTIRLLLKEFQKNTTVTMISPYASNSESSNNTVSANLSPNTISMNKDIITSTSISNSSDVSDKLTFESDNEFYEEEDDDDEVIVNENVLACISSFNIGI